MYSLSSIITAMLRCNRFVRPVIGPIRMKPAISYIIILRILTRNIFSLGQLTARDSLLLAAPNTLSHFVKM